MSDKQKRLSKGRRKRSPNGSSKAVTGNTANGNSFITAGSQRKQNTVQGLPDHKPTVGLNIRKIERQKRDNELPYQWEGKCECGWERNFGGMELTAQRECERHEDKARGHSVTLWKQKLLRPVKPMPRRQTIKKGDLPKKFRPTRNLPDL